MNSGYFVYDYSGQRPAAGLRQYFEDPQTGETFLVTGSVRRGDTLVSTLRKLRWTAVPDSEPAANPPPVLAPAVYTLNVPAGDAP